jgi:hypothetical protein
VGRVRNSILAIALTLGTASAHAQSSDSVSPAPAPLVHALIVDGHQLRAGQFVYETTLERDASTTLIGTQTITVSQTTYATTPAWLFVETRLDDGIAATDSLFADFTTLRPMHWNSLLGQARLAVEFRGDTAYGATSAPTGRRSIVASAPGTTLATSAMLENVLRVLPLQLSWEDSATVLSVSPGGFSAVPARLSVIGDDRVRVPAGTFDCWVVSVHAGDAARGLYWVTKTNPIVVRTTLDVPALGGAQLVSSLRTKVP